MGLSHIAILWQEMGSSLFSSQLSFRISIFLLISNFVCRYLGGLFFLMYRLPFHESIMYGALISATDPVSVLAIFQVLMNLLPQFCIGRCSRMRCPIDHRFWVVVHGGHNRLLSYEWTLACMLMPSLVLLSWSSSWLFASGLNLYWPDTILASRSLGQM